MKLNYSMRIGINCQSIYIPYEGGINTYVFGLLNGFSKQDTGRKYIIFLNKGDTSIFLGKLDRNNFKIVELSNIRSYMKKIFMFIPYLLNSTFLWKIFNDLYALLIGDKKLIEKNCDVLYTPSTVINIFNLKIPTIVSMHDIQHVHFPEFFRKHDLKIRHLTFKNTALHADYFQASTEFIKMDLLQNFKNLKQNQIFVIEEGVDIETFTKKQDEEYIDNNKYPKKFLFYPAQLWKHKNHITILKALRKLKSKGLDIELILCGEEYSYNLEVTKYIKKHEMNNVTYLGKIKFQELRLLYHKAFYVISAALYESSSLIIKEAAASGLPIITSDIEAHIQQTKSLKVNYFEAENVENLSDLLEYLFFKEDANHRNEKILYNLKNIKKYNWKIIAKKYNLKIDELICQKRT